jgi:GMP synthase (glutamine-hydrolysing)
VDILVFRHARREHLGWIAPCLGEGGLEFEYADLNENGRRHVSAASASGLIVMGGPMSVNDDLPYLRRELGVIDEALAAGKPILGICLGAQLVAKALGADVYRNPVKEIGWGPITRTDAGHRDPLFAGLRDPETVLHWHEETFDLPRAAILLASSDNCRHQAFRYGSNVYAIQFHLEATPDMIENWSAAEEVCAADGEIRIDSGAHAERMQELAQSVFGGWVQLVKQHHWRCAAS